MLDLVTKSEVRKKIILLLVYNPGKDYYLREIARLAGVSAGNAKQELLKIKKSGFLTEEKRGNSVYFKIDTENPLFGEFKNIVDKTIGIRKILEDELGEIKNIDFAFLFGSYVKGGFSTDSDIDLYVIGDIEEDKIYKAVKKAEEKIHREINYHLAPKEEFREKIEKSFFHKEVLEKFILLIGDENEFREFIK